MGNKRSSGMSIGALEDKELLVHFGDEPKIDRTTGIFVGPWYSGGYEPADSSWELNREVTSTATNLTGGQTVRSYTAGPVTSAASIIPGTPLMDHIEWPEQGAKDGVIYLKHSAKVAKGHVARVHKFGNGIVGIMVSREKAGLTAASRSQANDPAGRAVNIDYENGSDEFMFERIYYLVGEDDSVLEVTPKIFQTVADVEAQVTAGTAFVPDASASGLAAFVPVEDDEGLIDYEEPENP